MKKERSGEHEDDYLNPVPRVGSADLNPLDRGEGGMLMDPKRLKDPKGSDDKDKPKPKYDPIGPLDIPGKRPPKPDPDHFPPPGNKNPWL